MEIKLFTKTQKRKREKEGNSYDNYIYVHMQKVMYKQLLITFSLMPC